MKPHTKFLGRSRSHDHVMRPAKKGKQTIKLWMHRESATTRLLNYIPKPLFRSVTTNKLKPIEVTQVRIIKDN